MVFLRNQYFRFIFKSIFLLIVVVLFDQIIGHGLRYFYFKQESGLLYRTTFAIDSTTADVIVFGSSRANHHYVPEVFEQKLKLSFYNAGRDGNFILFNYAVFRAIIARHKPKIVIFDLVPEDFFYDPSSYDRLSSLLPYYKDHPEIRRIINLKGSFEKIKLLSAIYPFNSMALTIATGNLSFNKKRKPDIKGFVPLYGSLDSITLEVNPLKKQKYDKIKINTLKSIINESKTHCISLILCKSPKYKISSTELVDSIINTIIIEKNVLFYDFTTSIQFLNNPSNFKDAEHLNYNGAKLFSTMIADSIKHNIKFITDTNETTKNNWTPQN